MVSTLKLPPLLVASVLMKLIFFCVTFFPKTEYNNAAVCVNKINFTTKVSLKKKKNKKQPTIGQLHDDDT